MTAHLSQVLADQLMRLRWVHGDSKTRATMLSIALTWVASLASLVLVEAGRPLAAGLTFLVIGHIAFAFDCLDGKLARRTGTASPAGAGVDALADVLAWSSVAALVVTQLADVPAAPLVTALAVVGLVAKCAGPLWTVADRYATVGVAAGPGGPDTGARRAKRLLTVVIHLTDHALVLTLIAICLAVDLGTSWVLLAAVLAAVGLAINGIAVASMVRLDLARSRDA